MDRTADASRSAVRTALATDRRGVVPARGGRERGSAIAEFVLVSALLLIVALGVFQLGLALFVRNSLISAASEGARYGARADSSAAEGADRTGSLIRAGLNDAFAGDVSASERSVDGIRVVQVVVRAPLPVVGLLGPAGVLTVSGRAFSERQVTGARS